jgi:hypothetical protein
LDIFESLLLTDLGEKMIVSNWWILIGVSEHELTEEEEHLVAKMEEIISFFLDCLKVIGGYLAPTKRAYYLTRRWWKDSIPRLL